MKLNKGGVLCADCPTRTERCGREWVGIAGEPPRGKLLDTAWGASKKGLPTHSTFLSTRLTSTP